MDKHAKLSRMSFKAWLARNEDRLLEEYGFDLHESTRTGDPEELKAVVSFREYAKSRFAMARDDGELEEGVDGAGN